MPKMVKTCFLVLVTFLIFGPFSNAGAAPDEVVQVATKNYILRFTNGQGVIVINKRPALQTGTITLEWGPQYFLGARAVKTGANTVSVTYRVYNGSPSEYLLTARYTCLPDNIQVEYELEAPDKANTGGTMVECAPLGRTSKGELVKRGLWKRARGVREAYEVRDGYFRHFSNPYKNIMLRLNGNHNWTGDNAQHIKFLKVGSDGGKSKYTSKVDFYVLPKELSVTGAAAAARRAAVVELSTAKPYNLFNAEDGPPKFTAKISNVLTEPLQGELTVVARTLDNDRVVNKRVNISLKGLSSRIFQFSLPQAERELYFVEASLKVNGIEHFSRANVAVLPHFEFKHSDKSVFGISDYFPLPDVNSPLVLMKRMGVHHLRDGDNREVSTFGMLAYAHLPIRPESKVGDSETCLSPDSDDVGLKVCLDEFVDRGNTLVEFGNEWNLLDTWETDLVRYCEWAQNAFKIRNDNNLPIKIITQGIGGWYENYLKYLMGGNCCGGFEGVAFHPGRHNFTADAEDGDVEDQEAGNWNYYGTVKHYMNYVRNKGNIRAYATEVYAGTMPNAFQRDSYRQAAGNIILSMALGLAEGLSSIQVYQLNDGIRDDQGGVYDGHDFSDGRDQYHYGLLMRDLSLKPSAMAYAATAEILDGAKFVKYLRANGSTLRALVFETDAGKVTILWDRNEGYIQGQGKLIHKEPWLPSYTEKRSYKFHTTKSEVTVVDVIGRRQVVTATDGKVELELTGEPIFVYDIILPDIGPILPLLLD